MSPVLVVVAGKLQGAPGKRRVQELPERSPCSGTGQGVVTSLLSRDGVLQQLLGIALVCSPLSGAP